jgi:hypothetical protein
MSAVNIGAPSEYLQALRNHIKAHKQYHGGRCAYTDDWRLKVVSKTNRHTDTNGYSWGWFEIEPIGKTVGYWGEHRNDLKGFDINAWNKEAQSLSPVEAP